ncbi:CAP domain-containing protein [Gymnopilus junonius]|uniref:CAP domain-containing protein n=1 Tax=Gymnopilus junonius TaxID=109634 RepID=A0A9P5P1X8_GYMJU|nr:CAP domain-containing protein [Gymnopilus junonius]
MLSLSLLCALAFVLSFIKTGHHVHAYPSLLHRHDHLPLHSMARRGTVEQIDAFLDSHNFVRAQHNATALQWSTDLAQKAESWADQCQFRHTNGVLSGELYGENIAAGTGDFPITAAVATFVQDQNDYNPAHPNYLHFTQVVWKSTTELGCAVSQCPGIFDKSLGLASLYVCLYNPVGNVIGQAPGLIF